MTPQELYERYQYNNPDDGRVIETITITHSDITQDYSICREPDGETCTNEDGIEVFYSGVNFEVSKNTSSDDLDESFSVVFADVDGDLKKEAANIPLNTDEFVRVVYRAFMDADRSYPAYGPITLEATDMTASNDGTVTITAKSPSLNVNRCGELYTYERFPSLKSFL